MTPMNIILNKTCYYRIAGNVGEDFNLAIGQTFKSLQIKLDVCVPMTLGIQITF